MDICNNLRRIKIRGDILASLIVTNTLQIDREIARVAQDVNRRWLKQRSEYAEEFGRWT